VVMVLRADYRSGATFCPAFTGMSSPRFLSLITDPIRGRQPRERRVSDPQTPLDQHLDEECCCRLKAAFPIPKRPWASSCSWGKAEGRMRNAEAAVAAIAGARGGGGARLPPEGGVPAAVAAVPGGREALICGIGVPNLSLLMSGGTRGKRPPLPGPLLLGWRGRRPAVGFRRRDAGGCDRDGRAHPLHPQSDCVGGYVWNVVLGIARPSCCDGGTACPAIASERRRKKRGGGWLRRGVRRLACHWRTLRNL
jgi:hypothetical protein